MRGAEVPFAGLHQDFTMKILFVWTGVTSYMADCWRELASRPDVELEIVVERHDNGREFDAGRVLRDLDCTLVSGVDEARGLDLSKPDMMFAVGWHSRTVRYFVERPDWRDVPKICCSDMPWRWKLRCIAARFVLWRYLRRFKGMLVPGRIAARYARWLGFAPDEIHAGMYATDVRRFSAGPEDAPRTGFMYIGRHVPEKRLDLLEKAYGRYREMGGTWTLDVYGGDNFVQPDEVPGLYAAHAALVLASDFEPWGVVVLEAAAAGLALVCTDTCGACHELVKGNGIVVPHGDAEAFARAMLRMEREYASFDRSQGLDLASAYGCERWADRILEISGGPQ
jgi:glycosyltransferase involved in cell wall biosynthesis